MATPEAQVPSSAPEQSARDKALLLLLDQAKLAIEKNELDRADSYIQKVLTAEETSSGRGDHSVRMDSWRVYITAAMVLGLFGIVAYAFHKNPGDASPYVSLMSGLAGIALGWLFGSGTATALGKPTSGGTGTRARRQRDRSQP